MASHVFLTAMSNSVYFLKDEDDDYSDCSLKAIFFSVSGCSDFS